MRNLQFSPSKTAHVTVASDHSERVIFQLSQAIVSAIRTSHSRCNLLPHMFLDLAKWKQRPSCLTTMAYELCSAILENYSSLADGEQLLFLSLEIGFRHLDSQYAQISSKPIHTEHHQRMVDVVFESGDDEAIADFLRAWTSSSDCHKPPESLSVCVRHLIGLRPSSRRLRQLVIRMIGSIGYEGFGRVGSEKFFELLDHLHVSAEDIDDKEAWLKLLLGVVGSPEGIQRLPHPYWELLLELSISEPRSPGDVAWSPRITACLEDDQEWDKLECWMGVVWVAWPPEVGSVTEENVRRAMLSLFRQRPGAVPKLELWVRRGSERRGRTVSETFRRICERARPKTTRHLDAP